MNAKLKQNKASRQVVIDDLEEIFHLAQNAVTDESLHVRFQLRYEVLDDLYEKFLNFHNQIIVLLSTTENPDYEAEKTLRTAFLDNYFTIKTIHVNLFPDVKPEASHDSVKTPNVKLPKITLPNFEGDYKNWPTFYDLFKSLVHENSSLSEIEKFQYLLSSLSGQALNLLKGFPLTSQNYHTAFQTLKERYQNKRLLANTCWKEIYNVPKMQTESATGLRKILEVFSENLSVLNNLGLPVAHWDFVLFHLLIQKLDTPTIRRFELQECSTDIPSFNNLQTFLLNQCTALESVALSVPHQHDTKFNSQKSKTYNAPTYKRNSALIVHTKFDSDKKESVCNYCKLGHTIYKCPSFLEKSTSDRLRIVKEKNWCTNCLHSGHQINKCSSKSSCRTCNEKHHSLLHMRSSSNHSSNSQTTFSNQSESSGDSVPKPAQVLTNVLPTRTTVLLATAQVEILDAWGRFQKVRVLLDGGSQINIISQSCVNRLGLKTSKIALSILGIGDSSSSANSCVVCTIRPTDQVNPSFTFDAIVLSKICAQMPSTLINFSYWSCVSSRKLADPDFATPGSVDILLGADVFPLILRDGRLEGDGLEPTALQTVFGWVFMGKIQGFPPTLSSFHASIDESSINATLKKFWELEEVPKLPILSQEDEFCEQFFKNCHSRDASGRYTVALPFKNDDLPSFGDTYSLAFRRLLSLERRLIKASSVYDEYRNFMSDYISSNHMSLITSDFRSENSFYIPHHCVIKPDSVSTKLRVVFDASACVPGNPSLNDTLCIGPKLQKDIVVILLNFRIHNFVLTADIKQMYRQILIQPSHRDFQRILWRFSPREPVQEYQLNTVTYGISPAPFLALRTLFQLAQDEKHSFPNASKVLLTDVYVDDIVTGCDDLEEAKVLQKELIALLHKGGFQLRKWCSNNVELLSSIPPDHQHQNSLNFDVDPVVKILGLKWFPSLDEFTYSTNVSSEVYTKRAILSDISRIFDPLGFLSPFTFLAKHLIQHLWTLGLQWDDPLPQDVTLRWKRCRSELAELSKLKIPRKLASAFFTRCELHGFGDSSERGYGAVIYLRFFYENASIGTSFVCAKSKVAPVRRISLPRLELCACLLLSKLINLVYFSYSKIFRINSIFAWSDSTVALTWIKSSPHRWKSFVSNRTTQIQELVSPKNWHHVKTRDNPADCASRGLTPGELLKSSLWWVGPDWLRSGENVVGEQFDPVLVSEEERQISLSTFVSQSIVDDLLSRFSSLSQIKRIMSYVLRFVHNLKNPRRFGVLSSMELKQAFFFLIKYVQQSVFSTDIHNLINKKPISKPLRKLNPFLGEDGLLRVGGRLSFSGLAYEHKHPALLPSSHRLTELVIQYFHQVYLHPGAQTLQYLLAQQVWILSARRSINKIIAKCHTCFRLNPKPFQPFMGDLPSLRVGQLKPFQCVGVDFGGPFAVTLSKSRGSKSMKSYVCLFVCFTTKALHLELVSDLTSDAFLAALRRFIARRGRCNFIFSDRGTNFKGAYRDMLKYMHNAVDTEKIDWSFNPPSGPHFGGLWESGIKSVKSHLLRVIGDQVLSYEEFYTVLTQIEALLNSRPLCPLSNDPNDLSALTPGHFLTLAPLSALPEPDLTSLSLNRLSRWQLLSRLHQDFWKRWHSEYLNTLQQRKKWYNQDIKALSPGMLVLIKDEQLPPLRWRLARIETLHYGADKIARVATVRTTQGILQRPLVKLCPLPSQ